MSDYRLVIHMSPNFHDSPNSPYFWCIMKYDDGLSNSASGWADTPEQAFADGEKRLKYIMSDEDETADKHLYGKQATVKKG